MARIYNKNVQENALKFLQVHYQKKFETSPVFAQKNVKTKKGHKLSGLVACHKTPQGTFTASMEVRSLASIHKFFPFLSEINWLWKTVLAAILLFAFTSGIGHFFPLYYMHVLIPAVVMLAACFVYGTLKGDHKNFSETALVNYLKRTPANEKWLVLTIDSDVMALHAKIDILRYQCERKGIGILSVSHGRKVSIVQLPKENLVIQNNYLSHYDLEQEINHFLTTQPAFTPVPAATPQTVVLSPVPVFVKAG